MTNKQRVRECFRSAVFKRDGHKCCFCSITENLDAHHITDRGLMPNGGYVLSNGITLCSEHHLLAEQFHITNGQSPAPGFTPEELYKRVESSYEKAYNASLKCK